MGRRKYFCDFCQRFFNDDPNARSLHLKSTIHLQLKEEHYRNFKDARTIYQEESMKKPCLKFRNEGYCKFGTSCKYSHMLPEDEENLRKQIEEPVQNLPNPNDWWSARLKNQADTDSTKTLSYKPPEGSFDLPPSLKPFDIAEFLKSDIPMWGGKVAHDC